MARLPVTLKMPEWTMAKIPKSIPLKWPVGPHYLRWVDGKGVHAWARYKLRCADWYLAALIATAREAGDLDRYVGVEMALDGALTALCAAVDAAGFGLLDAVLRYARVPDSEIADTVERGWGSLLDVASSADIALDCNDRLVAALAGDGGRGASGWFAQLRQLRDATVRHNVLLRKFSVSGEQPGRFIDVPGLGAQRPVEYLRSVTTSAQDLVEALLAEIDLVERAALRSSRVEPRRGSALRPLPDLSARARVVGPN